MHMRIYEITSSKKTTKIANANRNKSDAFRDYQAELQSATAKQAEAKRKYERKRVQANDTIRNTLAPK